MRYDHPQLQAEYDSISADIDRIQEQIDEIYREDPYASGPFLDSLENAIEKKEEQIRWLDLASNDPAAHGYGGGPS